MIKSLYTLSYVSDNIGSNSLEQIQDILLESVLYNEQRNITGILLYNKEKFFQILEGEKNEVLKLYEKIIQDARHRSATLLHEGHIDKRIFGDWNMAFKSYTEQYNVLDTFEVEHFDKYYKESIESTSEKVSKLLHEHFKLS